MATPLRPRLNPFSARLSRRITLWVFLSILVVEILILIPSVQRRRREMLAQYMAIAAAKVQTIERLMAGPTSSTVLLDRTRVLLHDPNILGGTLYGPDQQLIGSFGEAPTWVPDNPASQMVVERAGDRPVIDWAWAIAPEGQPHILVLRLDGMSVQRDAYAFIGRIAGLVLIIAIFVTVSTMLTLDRLIIGPLVLLRDDMQRAGSAARADRAMPPLASLGLRHRDEMGDMIHAFDQMVQQITEAIAERKRSETALRLSEERFRTLVEQAADAIFVINANGRLINVNQQACHNLGYTVEELTALSVSDIEIQISADRFTQLWERLSHGELLTLEGMHRRKDGSTFPVEVRADQVEAGGEPLVLAIARDVSDRKQTEQALARLAEIGELASMIVHEVRNPLTTIMMGLTALSRSNQSERDRVRLSLALDEAERLKRLLNGILLYARRQQLQVEPIELIQFMDDLLDNIRALPSSQNRSIQWASTLCPLYVQGDRDKLTQVLINLVSNACEAIDEGDGVTCTAREHAALTHLVEIQIHNGGPPIPPDVLPRLTQPFITTKSNGNGLGLAIVKRIIEAHQGTLTIESTAIAGTTVTICLPKAQLPV